MEHFTISSTIKHYPNHPYEEIKNRVLGKRYRLSLVFIGPDRARSLNQQNRGKSYIPNVLSFPLAEAAGEIYLCPTIAYREASRFDLSLEGYVAYLFIHGLLHLKGLEHGDTMEQQERKYCAQFGIS